MIADNRATVKSIFLGRTNGNYTVFSIDANGHARLNSNDVYTLKVGSGVTFTTNGTELTIAATAGNITTNGNQFLGVPLSIKNGALFTNVFIYNAMTIIDSLGTIYTLSNGLASFGGSSYFAASVSNASTWDNAGLFSAYGGIRQPTMTANRLAYYDGANNLSNFLAGTAGQVLTSTGSGINWSNAASGSGSLSGSTNFVQLSVQAANRYTTNYPGIDSSWPERELVYYKTNAEGAIASLVGTWNWLVPKDYATNSLNVILLSSLVVTNGPNTSNTIFRVSVAKSTPGSGVDIHAITFGTAVAGTNTWTASAAVTNNQQSVQINLGTASLLKAGDMAVIKIDRDAANDTFGGPTALNGQVQLEYTRP